MSSVLRRNAAPPATARPMVGDTKTSMVRVDHIGWLVCDGRELSVDEYRALFNVLGHEFGGSGNTFKLPNAQGRVMGLIGMAEGVSPARNWVDGDVSGEEVHTLTIAELPAHNHDISGGALNTDNGVDPSGNGNTSLDGIHSHSLTRRGNEDITAHDPGNGRAAESSAATTDRNTVGTFSTSQDPGHRHQIASNGGSEAHNNMQPTLFLGNLFIYSGLPTRNITAPDGLSPPSGYPSYYPPSVPANRLY